jgi:alkanesulfonate monooxygenase SsuD/methylene tetrahydromethanopterin reductase-like flavin-dependent oxidoreductase (luciferase family)
VGTPHRNPFQLENDPTLRQSLVCGSPDECSRSLEELAGLGIDYVIFFVNLGGMEHDRVVESLCLFAREVMPRFAS